MGSENRFVYNPSTVDISRSKFMMNSFWKGSIYHGDLVPVEITRVMPGDSAIYDLSCFIRTATPPIAPLLDSIHLNIAAFYVPERLVWSKEKEFLGENTEGYGIQTEIQAPRSSSGSMSVPSSQAAGTNKRSLATYLGLVRQVASLDGLNPQPIALNPIRSFLQVYNDWFRNENFMSPYLWDHTQTGDGNRSIGTLNGSQVYGNSVLPKVCKQLDRYTSCLPWAQKGNPIRLPIAYTAPVVAKNDTTGVIVSTGNGNVYGDSSNTTGFFSTGQGVNLNGALHGLWQSGSETPGSSDQFSLVTDLYDATSVTINQLRLSFATQKYLEQLARSGSKYREYIKGMFGVNIGDTTAQMAEYLGGMTIDLNIDQVLQTTDFAAGSSTKLGAPGAVSTSAASQSLFTKSFTEPGFIVVVAYTKHNRTYGQGIDDIYLKHTVLEEYNPKFANIGETAIPKSLIYFDGSVGSTNAKLGFQEAWSEYRFKKDVVVGELCPSNTNSLNFWSLADNFASAPALNADFLTEDRTNIARCLSGGESSPDYFLDIKFKRTFVRPMPLYSIPGLIDHH